MRHRRRASRYNVLQKPFYTPRYPRPRMRIYPSIRYNPRTRQLVPRIRMSFKILGIRFYI